MFYLTIDLESHSSYVYFLQGHWGFFSDEAEYYFSADFRLKIFLRVCRHKA